MRLLPLLFIAAPLTEIVAFGLVVEWLGFWRALALVALTSLVGGLIVRHQGFGLVSKISAMAREGRPPASGLSGDLLTLLAGLLLLMPGFITDLLGILLFVPFIRNRISRIPSSHSRKYETRVYTATYGFGDAAAQDRPGAPVVDLGEEEYRSAGGRVSGEGGTITQQKEDGRPGAADRDQGQGL